MCKFRLKCTWSKLFYYFIKIRKGMCIKPNPVVFECCFEGSQKDFWFWKLLGGAQGVLWVANISQFLTVFCTPYKVVKIKHPFGMLQSNIQVLQDLVGFFLFKNMFCWDSLIWTYLLLFWQNNGGKAMNYVHLSQNLHILCAFKPKFAHTMCI